MKRYVLAIASIFICCKLQAQDPAFSQFMYNPVYSNPAFTGLHDGQGRSMMNYRSQEPSLPGALHTLSLTADYSLLDGLAGIGTTILRDVAGDGLLTTTAIGLPVAFDLGLSDKTVWRVAVEPQFIQRSVNIRHIRFADRIKGSRGVELLDNEPLYTKPVNMWNVNIGLVYQRGEFIAGIASHNVFEPEQTFYSGQESVLSTRTTLHGSYRYKIKNTLGKVTYFQPSAMLTGTDDFSVLNANLVFRHGMGIGGVGWRRTLVSPDALNSTVFLCGIRTQNIRLIYSAEMSRTDARSSAPWSHEISLMFTWNTKTEDKHHDAF